MLVIRGSGRNLRACSFSLRAFVHIRSGRNLRACSFSVRYSYTWTLTRKRGIIVCVVQKFRKVKNIKNYNVLSRLTVAKIGVLHHLRELFVELWFYHNLWGVKTTKSASVKRVLLSSATNTNRNYSAILATLQITSYVHSRNSS